MKIFKLEGVVQHYDWGGFAYIPSLLGQPITEEKYAEYWMGAHDKAPAKVVPTGQHLDEFIGEDPRKTLGKKVYERFGRLPYLFKVLDVKDMLSIQVHPTKKEAEVAFAEENKRGVPLNAPDRNYKDDNHKPEIMVALSEFWLLHGFRPEAAMRSILRDVPELRPLLPVFDRAGYRGLYQQVMEESVQETNSTLRPLIERILPGYEQGTITKAKPEFWAARAYQTFCDKEVIDKGIYSIFFFNIVQLAKGEGIFQDAGVPHAYMEGQNMELMANSDNVLRGGLTPKHVDVQELLKRVNFQATVPNVLQSTSGQNPREKVYESPVQDFALSKIELSEGEQVDCVASSVEIAIILEGAAQISCEGETLHLEKGEVFAATAATAYTISAKHSALFYKAACPV